MHDPFQKPKFDRDMVAKYFGPKSNAVAALALHRDNPSLYDAMRVSAEQEHGLVGRRSYFRPEDKPEPEGKKELTEQQQAAMTEFPRDVAFAYLKANTNQPGARNASRLAKEDPAAYQRLRIAGQAYGLLPSTGGAEVVDQSHGAHIRAEAERLANQSKAVENGEHKFRLADSIADEAGIERGTLVSMDDFGKITQQISVNRRNAEQREKESVKVDDGE